MSSNREFVVADVGNSRLKLGLFGEDRASGLPVPSRTLHLSPGRWQAGDIARWLDASASSPVAWRIASVNRENLSQLRSALEQVQPEAVVAEVTAAELSLPIELDHPERVGIDRLLAALAANHLRAQRQGAVVVDLGTAITVDLISEDGAFLGGSILPGIGMACRALSQQTDLLPDVAMRELAEAPPALGRDTQSAIRSGLFWGAVGAVRELLARFQTHLQRPPLVLLTGGAAPSVGSLLGSDVRYEPHLVLAGIVLAAK